MCWTISSAFHERCICRYPTSGIWPILFPSPVLLLIIWGVVMFSILPSFTINLFTFCTLSGSRQPHILSRERFFFLMSATTCLDYHSWHEARVWMDRVKRQDGSSCPPWPASLYLHTETGKLDVSVFLYQVLGCESNDDSSDGGVTRAWVGRCLDLDGFGT